MRLTTDVRPYGQLLWLPVHQKWTLTLSLITPIYTLNLIWPNPFDAGLERLKSLKQQNCEIYHFGLNYALASGVVSSFSESLLFLKKLSPAQKETRRSKFTYPVPQDFLYLFIVKLMQ